MSMGLISKRVYVRRKNVFDCVSTRLMVKSRFSALILRFMFTWAGTRICNKHEFRSRLHPGVVVDHTQLQPLSLSAASTKELINPRMTIGPMRPGNKIY